MRVGSGPRTRVEIADHKLDKTHDSLAGTRRAAAFEQFVAVVSWMIARVNSHT
jgi:hypothetical protein